ncbi:MAG: efflux transporter periplasmic adaptor subunit [Porticoccaceae bacterium]|nr:efflux transporter periplasmic adaptor subunit [Porticoccaceae bacterium]
MNKRMIAILTITVLVFGGTMVAKIMGNRMMNAYLNNMPEMPVTVSSSDVIEQKWTRQVSAVGTLAAVNGASLTTEVAGIVEEIHFDSGSEVKAGDAIISLVSATDEAELASLEAAVRLAELERDRVKSLLARKSISKAEVDRRETELAQARANAQARRSKLEQKTLRAPYAGRLGIRKVNIGQFVAAGDPMIALQSLDPVHLNFTLPEQWYPEVEAGLAVRVVVDALGSKVFTGKITAVEPTIDSNTRNFALQATLANPNKVLRPGMFARVEISLGEPHSVLTVPRTAINFNPYGNSVFILSEDKDGTLRAQQRLIQTGEVRGDVIAVSEGLELDEIVASSGLLKLRNGSLVNINNEVVPQASTTPTPDNG